MTERNCMKKRAWIVMLVVFFAGVSLAWQQNKVVPLVSTLEAVFHTDSSTVGWLSSVFSVMAIITAIPSAMILKKLGAKMCGVIALACAILGSVLAIFVDSLPLLIISRVIEGVGVGIISVVAPSVISMWFPTEKRGLPMGLWGSWQMVGQSAVFLLSASVVSILGWKGMWIVGVVVCAIAILLFVPIVNSPPPENNYADIESGTVDIRNGLKTPSAWLLGMVGFLFSFCCFGWLTWIVSAWVRNLGMQESLINNYLAYMFMLEIPMVILIGWIYDKAGKRHKIVGIVGAVLYAVALFIGYRIRNRVFLYVFLLGYPFFEGMVATFLWISAPLTVKEQEKAGIALAILTFCMNAGAVIGPPVIGRIVDVSGFSMAASIMALVMALGAALIFILKMPGAARE